MKTFALVTIVSLLLLGLLVNGATWRGMPDPKRHPNGCYAEDVGHMQGGETKRPIGKCFRVTCSSDGSMMYAGCGSISVDDPECVKLERDLTKPHPDCCQKYNCSGHIFP